MKWPFKRKCDDCQFHKSVVTSRDNVIEAKQGVINALTEEIAHLQEQIRDGTGTIEWVLNKGISWYDSSKLDRPGQQRYHADAQSALLNETLKNECNILKTDWIAHIVSKTKTYDEVRDLRMSINALECLLSRLENVANPRHREEQEEPFSTI